jgi:glycopeptide antibiotics resistance protein
VTLGPTSGSHDVELAPWTEPNAVNILGNVLLFAPLGAGLRLLGLRLRHAAAAGCALSVAIEAVQLAIPGRTTSTADVLCNTAGAALGWWIASRAR